MTGGCWRSVGNDNLWRGFLVIFNVRDVRVDCILDDGGGLLPRLLLSGVNMDVYFSSDILRRRSLTCSVWWRKPLVYCLNLKMKIREIIHSLTFAIFAYISHHSFLVARIEVRRFGRG